MAKVSRYVISEFFWTFDNFRSKNIFLRFDIPLSLFGKTPTLLLGLENFSLRYEKPVINIFFSLETLKNIDKVHITWMSYPCMKFDHWFDEKKSL